MTDKLSHPDQALLEMIQRALDGDLSRDERRELFERLAANEEARMLMREAVQQDKAAVILRAACDAAPVPDLTGSILAALGREDAAVVKPKASPLWGALKNAFAAGGSASPRAPTGNGLDLADLAGVVAGTGAPSAEPDSAAAGPQIDAAEDEDLEGDK